MAEYKLTKDLTINNIGEIYDGIAQHLSQFNHLSLAIPGDMEMDFSGVQLLHSLKKVAQESNKTVSIRYIGPEAESNPFTTCDFEEIISNKYKTHE